MRRPLVVSLVAIAIMTGAAQASGSHSIGLKVVYSSLRQTGFRGVRVYTNFGLVRDQAQTLNHPSGSPFMVAVPAYRPRFGPISAVWFSTVAAATRFNLGEQPFLRGATKPLPSDLVLPHIREIRVCNVVVTTGEYPKVARSFRRAVRLLQAACQRPSP